MRLPHLLLAASLAIVGGCASVATDADRAAPALVGNPARDALAAALANPARSEADRERDLRDLPADVLGLAGFRPGMTIADIFGGGGYYSEIIAGIVGPKGHVRLINNPSYDGYAKKGLATRLAGNRLPTVDYEVMPPNAMTLGDRTLDGALIVMSYHDLYVNDPADNWPAIDAGQFIDQIVAGLKPGGVLLIVDHQARPGSGKDDAQKLHRIEESFAIADFKAHGLDFVGSIPVLRHAEDDHSLNVFDKAIRGKTDRFVHLYRKP
jgi:predicted methyltransferase